MFHRYSGASEVHTWRLWRDMSGVFNRATAAAAVEQFQPMMMLPKAIELSHYELIPITLLPWYRSIEDKFDACEGICHRSFQSSHSSCSSGTISTYDEASESAWALTLRVDPNHLATVILSNGVQIQRIYRLRHPKTKNYSSAKNPWNAPVWSIPTDTLLAITQGERYRSACQKLIF